MDPKGWRLFFIIIIHMIDNVKAFLKRTFSISLTTIAQIRAYCVRMCRFLEGNYRHLSSDQKKICSINNC